MPDKPIKKVRERRSLRRASKSKRAWLALYFDALREAIALDPLCRKCRERRAIEGHHPNGRSGVNILMFYPLCRACHRGIEDNKKQARKDGWITYT